MEFRSRRKLIGIVFNTGDENQNDDGWSKFAVGDVNYATFYYAINTILSVVGAILNLLALCVLLQPSLRQKEKFVLIISMCVVDFLVCASVILYLNFNFEENGVPGSEFVGNLLCRFILNRYFTFCLSAISAWHVVMICIERYVSVRSPDWYDLHFTKLYPFSLIALSVLLGTVCMTPSNVTAFRYDPVNDSCVYEWPSKSFKVAAGTFQFTFMVIVPLGIMVMLYYKLYRRYKKFESLLANAPVAFDIQTKQKNKSQKVFYTVLGLVLFYIISWVPSELMWLVYTWQLGGISDEVFVGLPYILTQMLTILNSVVNPILYASSFGHFRYRFNASIQLLKEISLCLLCCNMEKLRQIHKLHTSQYLHPDHHTYRVSTTDTTRTTCSNYGTTNMISQDSDQLTLNSHGIQGNWSVANKGLLSVDSTESYGATSPISEYCSFSD
ncbi:neuropeptide Y receptor type 4-2-like isoform X2 [Symsagittifera roscoffensis]|uniref:neuropeptide Y receptor type 4-2-like isoform X2 n=1 Tax=Symsagittifera roscoffensis TaxID=84072 RepID=UPI00307B5A62